MVANLPSLPGADRTRHRNCHTYHDTGVLAYLEQLGLSFASNSSHPSNHTDLVRYRDEEPVPGADPNSIEDSLEVGDDREAEDDHQRAHSSPW